MILLIVFLLIPTLSVAATASWDAVTDPELQGYKLYRAPGTCANPGAFATVQTYGVVTSGPLPDPAANGTYCYKLTAFNPAGESAFSNAVDYTHTTAVPSAPLNFSITANPQQGSWPNEPAGFSVIAEHGLGVAGGGGGWTELNRDGAAGEYIADASAPVSPSGVLRNWRTSTTRNNWEHLHVFASPRNEFFFGTMVKLSNPHYGWFDWYQKLALLDSPTQHMYLHARHAEGVNNISSFHLVDQGGAYDNAHLVDATVGGGAIANNILQTTYANNVWHRIEVYYKGNTGTPTSRTGTLKMWVDGVLVMNHANANVNPAAEDIWLTHIWDSLASLPQEEWIAYDHVYVSGP